LKLRTKLLPAFGILIFLFQEIKALSRLNWDRVFNYQIMDNSTL